LSVDANKSDEVEQAAKVSKWARELEQEGGFYLYKYHDLKDLKEKLQKDFTSWIDSWSKIIAIYGSTFTKTIKTNVDMDRLFSDPLPYLERQLNPWLEAHIGKDHLLHDAKSKSWFWEELTYNCYIELDEDTINGLRIWSQILNDRNLGSIGLGQDFAKTLIPHPQILHSIQARLAFLEIFHRAFLSRISQIKTFYFWKRKEFNLAVLIFNGTLLRKSSIEKSLPIIANLWKVENLLMKFINYYAEYWPKIIGPSMHY
jgi:hypothetical protein